MITRTSIALLLGTVLILPVGSKTAESHEKEQIKGHVKIKGTTSGIFNN